MHSISFFCLHPLSQGPPFVWCRSSLWWHPKSIVASKSFWLTAWSRGRERGQVTCKATEGAFVSSMQKLADNLNSKKQPNFSDDGGDEQAPMSFQFRRNFPDDASAVDGEARASAPDDPTKNFRSVFYAFLILKPGILWVMLLFPFLLLWWNCRVPAKQKCLVIAVHLLWSCVCCAESLFSTA